jgi:predicted nucleic acid-binding protein
MMTNAAEPVFIDTNILVFASWAAAPLHEAARQRLAHYRQAGAPLLISRQVVREWLATLNRPRTGLALTDLVVEARAFAQHFVIADETAATTERLLMLLPQSAGARVHDVNIVATMQIAGVRRLVTHNPDDFAAFKDQIEILTLAT